VLTDRLVWSKAIFQHLIKKLLLKQSYFSKWINSFLRHCDHFYAISKSQSKKTCT